MRFYLGRVTVLSRKFLSIPSGTNDKILRSVSSGRVLIRSSLNFKMREPLVQLW